MGHVELYGLDWVASASTILRIWLFSNATPRSRIWGWWVGLIGGFFWMANAWIIGSEAWLAMNVVYTIINIRGIIRENRSNRSETSHDVPPA